MLSPIQNKLITFKAQHQQSRQDPIKDSLKIHRKLAENGFYKTPTYHHRLNYLRSEIEEFKDAIVQNDRKNMEEEVGDIIFNSILLADFFGINPTTALKKANKKLDSRLTLAQKYAKKPLVEYTYEERMNFWEHAKKTLKNRQEKKSKEYSA